MFFVFLISSLGQLPLAYAQPALPLAEGISLPVPGTRVPLSLPFDPPILKGIKIHPENPFRFDFILDVGEGMKQPLQQESTKLIKYFLASLTIPAKDLWVNLSPYEKDRIIPNSFGLTEMGRDLLAEDYMLKQITASLVYPEDEIGKKFWKRIYEVAAKRYGTTNIAVNTFNKVWIVPQKAVVYENAKTGTAYVVTSKLKVMLEQDYLSLEKHEGIQSAPQATNTNQLGSQIVREIVIPQLTTEVNENKNFARLRAIYNSLILATWYKNKVKGSILKQVYVDKNKVAGVNIDDPQEKERIYQQYLQAFKRGVYNYIKEDIDPATQRAISRKYFSGGLLLDVKIDYAQTISVPDKVSNEFVVSADCAMAGAGDEALTGKGSQQFINNYPMDVGILLWDVIRDLDLKRALGLAGLVNVDDQVKRVVRVGSISDTPLYEKNGGGGQGRYEARILKKIFRELLINAYDALPSHSDRINVQISLSGENLNVSIENNGRIDYPKLRKRLFDAGKSGYLYRSAKTDSRHAKGELAVSRPGPLKNHLEDLSTYGRRDFERIDTTSDEMINSAIDEFVNTFGEQSLLFVPGLSTKYGHINDPFDEDEMVSGAGLGLWDSRVNARRLFGGDVFVENSRAGNVRASVDLHVADQAMLDSGFFETFSYDDHNKKLQDPNGRVIHRISYEGESNVIYYEPLRNLYFRTPIVEIGGGTARANLAGIFAAGFGVGVEAGITPYFVKTKISGVDFIVVEGVMPVEGAVNLQELLRHPERYSGYEALIRDLFQKILDHHVIFQGPMAANIVIGYWRGRLGAWLVDADLLRQDRTLTRQALAKQLLEKFRLAKEDPYVLTLKRFLEPFDRAMGAESAAHADFVLEHANDDGYLHFNFLRLVLQKIRDVMEKNGYPLIGKMDPEGNDRKNFTPAWSGIYDALAILVENLDQHEYLEDASHIYLRVFFTTEPYNGIRVEFWGPGPESVALPEALKAKEWFSSVDRPWPEGKIAPAHVRSPQTSKRGQGINNIFLDLQEAEADWKLPPDQHILVSWKEDLGHQGPRAGGHIISLHIPVFPAKAVTIDQIDPAFEHWMKGGLMSGNDRKLLEQVLSGDEDQLKRLLKEQSDKISIKWEDKINPEKDGRSIYFNLDRPFSTSYGDITVLRIKGARPRSAQNGDSQDVQSYDGQGFTSKKLRVDEEGNWFLQFVDAAPSASRADQILFTPQGVMLKEKADLEYQLMRVGIQGRGFETDYPIAVGSWNNKMHAGRPTGFVIAGMRSEDVRINPSHILYDLNRFKRVFKKISRTHSKYVLDVDNLLRDVITRKKIPTNLNMSQQIYKMIGKSLRAYHDAGYFHQYPHAMNLGVEISDNKNIKVILRDLDTTIIRKDIKGHDLNRVEASYRFIDIQRVISDLHRGILEVEQASVEPLISALLEGYFYELTPGSQEFNEVLEQASSKECTAAVYNLRESSQNKLVLNGSTPFYGDVWQQLYDIALRNSLSPANTASAGGQNGGIDLSSEKVNLETNVIDSRFRGNDIGNHGNDRGIQFHLDPAMLEQLQNSLGFVPVIINVRPLTDLKAFLGLTE